MIATQKYQVSENIVIKVIEGEAVIVSPKTAMILSVNGVGTFILECLKEGKGQLTFEDLLDKLTDEYQISKELARGDLIEFLEELKVNNLIVTF